MSHRMMPVPTHDERAEQLFVRDLKSYIKAELDGPRRDMAEILESRERRVSNAISPEKIRAELFEHEPFRAAVSFQRASQELLWEVVSDSVERQIESLTERARIDNPIGSLTLDPSFTPPPYVAAMNTHLMPGGYFGDAGDGDIRQGAIMDNGGAVYMMGRNGRNGGMMNDGRAHSVVSHLYQFYADLQPRRILEIGCGVGNTTLAVARYFPNAEIVACDIGASILRYAHARAEHEGVKVHFHQASGEQTGFEGGSFDLVYTTVVFHEVSGEATQNIIHEMHRLLAPGGVAINLDAAGRRDDLTTWQLISGAIDMDFNNEYGWNASVGMDYASVYRQAGFPSSKIGYQPPVAKAERGNALFHESGYTGAGGSWYITSARKLASPGDQTGTVTGS